MTGVDATQPLSTMAATLCIRFIKENDLTNLEADDDTARITCTDVDQFSLTYSRSGAQKIILSSDEVFRWFRRQLRMLETRDVDPYEAIQVDLPGFQTLLVRVKDIDREYDTILDALDFALDHWPGMMVKEKPMCRRHYVWLD